MAKKLTGGYGDNMGKIFGHELVGEVEAVGSGVSGVKLGDRVVVNPNSYCCTCDACRNGYRNHCQNMELMGLTHPVLLQSMLRRVSFRCLKFQKMCRWKRRHSLSLCPVQ